MIDNKIKIKLETGGRAISLDLEDGSTYSEAFDLSIKAMEILYGYTFDPVMLADQLLSDDYEIYELRERVELQQQSFEEGFNQAVSQINEQLAVFGLTTDGSTTGVNRPWAQVFDGERDMGESEEPFGQCDV